MFKLFLIAFFILTNSYAQAIVCSDSLQFKTETKKEITNTELEDLESDIKTINEFYTECAVKAFKDIKNTTWIIADSNTGTSFNNQIDKSFKNTLKANAYYTKLFKKIDKKSTDKDLKKQKEELQKLMTKSENLSACILANFYAEKTPDSKQYIPDLEIGNFVTNNEKDLNIDESTFKKIKESTNTGNIKNLLQDDKVYNFPDDSKQNGAADFQKKIDELNKAFDEGEFNAYKASADPSQKKDDEKTTDEKTTDDTKEELEDKIKDLEDKITTLEEDKEKTEEEKKKEKEELEKQIKDLKDSSDDSGTENVVVNPSGNSSDSAGSGSSSGGSYRGGGLPSLSSYQKARERYDELRKKREQDLKNKEVEKLTDASRSARISSLRSGLKYKRGERRSPYSDIRKPMFQRKTQDSNRPNTLSSRYPSMKNANNKNIDYSKYYGSDDYNPENQSDSVDLFGSTYDTAKRRALLQDAGTGEFASRNIDPFLLNSSLIYDMYFKGEVSNKDIIPVE